MCTFSGSVPCFSCCDMWACFLWQLVPGQLGYAAVGAYSGYFSRQILSCFVFCQFSVSFVVREQRNFLKFCIFAGSANSQSYGGCEVGWRCQTKASGCLWYVSKDCLSHCSGFCKGVSRWMSGDLGLSSKARFLTSLFG